MKNGLLNWKQAIASAMVLAALAAVSSPQVAAVEMKGMLKPKEVKTFLSKIVGWRICQANQRILFTTAMDMLNHLLDSQVDHSLVRKLKTYTEPTALVVDELGYLALDQQTSNLFYLLPGHFHPSRPKALHHYHYQCLL